jgi:hypothetical protein
MNQSKVLNGTHVACGSWIGQGPDVMFRVSFSTIIMSFVLSFKFWKLNNDVLISFYAASRIWNWHSISWSVENYVISWCTCILGTWKFDALIPCYVVISSPLANKVCSYSVLRQWKDCGMTARARLAMVIRLEPNANPLVWITYLVAETLGATLASNVTK